MAANLNDSGALEILINGSVIAAVDVPKRGSGIQFNWGQDSAFAQCEAWSLPHIHEGLILVEAATTEGIEWSTWVYPTQCQRLNEVVESYMLDRF